MNLAQLQASGLGNVLYIVSKPQKRVRQVIRIGAVYNFRTGNVDVTLSETLDENSDKIKAVKTVDTYLTTQGDIVHTTENAANTEFDNWITGEIELLNAHIVDDQEAIAALEALRP